MKYFKTFGDFLKHLAELVSESELCSATKFINMAFKNPFPKCMHQYHDYQIPDHLYISLTITSTKAPMPVLAKSRVFVMLSHYDNWLVSKTARLDRVRQLCAVYLSTFLLAHHHHSSVGEVKSEGPDSSYCTTRRFGISAD